MMEVIGIATVAWFVTKIVIREVDAYAERRQSRALLKRIEETLSRHGRR